VIYDDLVEKQLELLHDEYARDRIYGSGRSENVGLSNANIGENPNDNFS
jgi:hypothetical protein